MNHLYVNFRISLFFTCIFRTSRSKWWLRRTTTKNSLCLLSHRRFKSCTFEGIHVFIDISQAFVKFTCCHAVIFDKIIFFSSLILNILIRNIDLNYWFFNSLRMLNCWWPTQFESSSWSDSTLKIWTILKFLIFDLLINRFLAHLMSRVLSCFIYILKIIIIIIRKRIRVILWFELKIFVWPSTPLHI